MLAFFTTPDTPSVVPDPLITGVSQFPVFWDSWYRDGGWGWQLEPRPWERDKVGQISFRHAPFPEESLPPDRLSLPQALFSNVPPTAGKKPRMNSSSPSLKPGLNHALSLEAPQAQSPLKNARRQGQQKMQGKIGGKGARGMTATLRVSSS